MSRTIGSTSLCRTVIIEMLDIFGLQEGDIPHRMCHGFSENIMRERDSSSFHFNFGLNGRLLVEIVRTCLSLRKK